MGAGRPDELTAARIVSLPGGELAEAVMTEQQETLTRWRPQGGPWSAWRKVAEASGARDVSLAADTTGWPVPAALLAVVAWHELPLGGIAANHLFYRVRHFRLTEAGISPADL